MGAGQFLAAERLLILARGTADEGAAQKARERLDPEDLMRGAAYERADARKDSGARTGR